MLGALVVPASGISVPENPSSLAGGSLRSPRRMSFSAAAVQSPGAASAVQTPGSAAASLYGVLRIDEDASPVEIKAAYRTLAKLYHPDADESDGRDFIRIHSAYATLSDPSARAIYDLSLGLQRGGARRRSAYSGLTRRWETDQCW